MNLTSAPMFKLANCAGVRIFSNWAPQTLPWGFDEPWASRATQTAHVFFVAVQCDKADVGGVSSFQNVSFVWELHTNLSAGPELEGRSWLELSATTSLHAGPADFQQALADIGVAAQLATVDSTPTGDAVRVDGDAGQIAISYETKSPYIPGPVLSPEDLISILDIEPLALLSGTVAFAAPYDVAWPTIIANGSFAITALEDYWPAPIYWGGGPIERASYEFEVERFP